MTLLVGHILSGLCVASLLFCVGLECGDQIPASPCGMARWGHIPQKRRGWNAHQACGQVRGEEGACSTRPQPPAASSLPTCLKPENSLQKKNQTFKAESLALTSPYKQNNGLQAWL